MRIWSITIKDLQVFFSDRGAIFYLFILPLVFIFLFAGIGASQVRGSESEKIPLAVVNLDKTGEAAQTFLADLGREGGINVLPYQAEEAQRALSRLKIRRYLTIPENFNAELQAGRPVTLVLLVHPNTSASDNELLQRAISGVGRDLSLETQILNGLRQMGEMQAGSPASEQAFQAERVIAQAESQFAHSRQQPLVTIEQSTAAKDGAQEQGNSSDFMVVSVAGSTVLFVFLAAQNVARSIYDEKRSGSFRRLLAAPIHKPELLVGKLLPNLLLTLLQVVVIFLVGMLAFSLLGWGCLTLGSSPLAWAAVSLAVALCSTSLGIFLASLAKTEAQVGGYSTVALWISGMVGGAFIPTFLMPSFVQAIARFVPHYWASQAYYDVLVRGEGLAEVAPNLIALLAFTLIFYLIGLWRFEYD